MQIKTEIYWTLLLRLRNDENFNFLLQLTRSLISSTLFKATKKLVNHSTLNFDTFNLKRLELLNFT